MLVSIVIPVYNVAPYLEKCISSLQNQTHKELEIICVNDGSTDDSLTILTQIAESDGRIHVFSKENEAKGAAPARNMGLKYASGEYIMVLDSDDFFEEDMIEKLLNKALKTNADMVICTARHYDHFNQCSASIFKRPEFNYAPQKEPFSWKDCPQYIFQISEFVAWNKFFKRDFFEKNNLRFEGIPISDDQYPAVMGAVLAERIAIVDEPLINYRFNTGLSQMNSQSKHPEASYQAVFSVVNRMRELKIYDYVKQSYCNIAILLMRQYFDRMTSIENVRFLYNKFRDEVFPFLGAMNCDKDYFYDYRVGEWYEMITKCSLDELLFIAARAHGCDMTTAAIRFQVPFEDIRKGSTVAVVGKGIAGRYWYSQLILSDICKNVFWLSTIDELPKDVFVDKVLVAK